MSHLMQELKVTADHFLKDGCKNDESFILALITVLAGEVTITHNQLIELAVKIKQM